MTRPRPALAGVLLSLALTACGAHPDDPGRSPASESESALESESASSVDGVAPVAPSTGATPGTASEPPRPVGDVPELLRFEAKTIDGEVFDGATLHGAPAVLWFWAPWCPTCQAEAPTVAEVARIDGVRFVGVAAQDQVPAMRDFVDRFALGSFPHIADTGAVIWQRFGVTYQPAYAFVHADGTVEVEQELLTPDELRDRVRALR